MKQLIIASVAMTALLCHSEDALERYHKRRAAEARQEAKESNIKKRIEASRKRMRENQDGLVDAYFKAIDYQILKIWAMLENAKKNGDRDEIRELQRTLDEVKMINAIGRDNEELRDEIFRTVERAVKITDPKRNR